MYKQVCDNGRVVIPKELRDKLKLQSGELIDFKLVGRRIIITNHNDPFENYLNKMLKESTKDSQEIINKIYEKYKELN